MSNSTLDNIPIEYIKPPIRIPNVDKDIILIDNERKRRETVK